MMDTADELLIEVKDRIAYVTLNRPHKRNAINASMMRTMRRFLDESKLDETISVVVINGAGKDFCSGHDLLAHKEIGSGPRPWREDQARAYLDFIYENWYWPLKEYSKPIIGAVQGNAAAGGAELALLCDITIGSDDMRLNYDILRVTGVMIPQMIAYTSGWKIANEVYLTGGVVEAQEALRYNMVNRLVKRENLLAEATRTASIIARMPHESVKLSKLAIRNTMDLMGMRQSWFYAKEGDILAHLIAGDEVESNMRHEQGARSAIDWRRARFADLEQPLD